MEYYQTNLNVLNEDHLLPINHNETIVADMVKKIDNTRFIIIDESGNENFHVIGYKKEGEVFVHKCSQDKIKKNYAEYFCDTYKIDLEKNEFEWLYDELFDCDIIVSNEEIVNSKLVVIRK